MRGYKLKEVRVKNLPDMIIPEFSIYLGKVEAHPPISGEYEPDWQDRDVWYNSQKQHVRGWLVSQMNHGGSVKFHRDILNISTRTSYNRWNNPGMALWLAEALGADGDAVRAACEEAYGEPNKMKRSGIVRKHFPYEMVLELVAKDPEGAKLIVHTPEELDKKRIYFLYY